MSQLLQSRVAQAMGYCGIRRTTTVPQKLWYLANKVCVLAVHNANLREDLAQYRYYTDMMAAENAQLVKETRALAEQLKGAIS